MTKSKDSDGASVQSIVRRPLVGWINDHEDWTDSVIDLCEISEIVADHYRFGLMREFLASPKRCDVIVLDVGEIGRINTTMPRVCDYCRGIVLVSAMTLASTLVVVEMVQESFPDTDVRYAALRPEETLAEMLA